MDQLFWGFSKFQTPKNIRRKFEFPEIAQNHDCGGFGSPVHQDTFNFEISAPKAGCENAHKNYPNLHFAYNFATFQFFSMGLVLFDK